MAKREMYCYFVTPLYFSEFLLQNDLHSVDKWKSDEHNQQWLSRPRRQAPFHQLATHQLLMNEKFAIESKGIP